MALDANRLGAAMSAAVVAGSPGDGAPVSQAALDAIWVAIATEIINEFKNNGEVATPDTLTGTIS